MFLRDVCAEAILQISDMPAPTPIVSHFALRRATGARDAEYVLVKNRHASEVKRKLERSVAAWSQAAE
jgi:hypothetical protein